MTKQQPRSQTLVVSDFGSRLKELQQLQRDAHDAFRQAVPAMLGFAVKYSDLYEEVSRNAALVSRLNSALGLKDWEATRWRTIAGQARSLKSIQRSLPPAFEPIYEVARLLKRDQGPVLKAVESEKLTSSSKMRDIRDIGKRPRSRGPASGASKPSKINVTHLKSLGMTFRFSLTAVPRPNDVETLRKAANKALSKLGARFIELDDTERQRLETYWALKDEADTMKESVGPADERADLENRWSKAFEGGSVWSR